MAVSVAAPVSTPDSHPAPDQPERQVISGIGGVCPAGCGVKITMEDGRIKQTAPLKGHPQGICCARGTHAAEIVYSPDRLLYPMKRAGPRGAGQFARVSWDEALNTIADQLQRIADQHGPQAVCMYTGRGTFERSLWELLSPAGVRESSAWGSSFQSNLIPFNFTTLSRMF